MGKMSVISKVVSAASAQQWNEMAKDICKCNSKVYSVHTEQ